MFESHMILTARSVKLNLFNVIRNKGGKFLEKLWCCVGGGVWKDNLFFKKVFDLKERISLLFAF